MSTDIIKEVKAVPPDSSGEQGASRNSIAQWLQIAVLTLLIGCFFFGIGWWRSGDMAASLAYLQGERLIFTPANLIIEDAKPGEVVERTVVVKNLSNKTITLLGSQKSCGCITLDQFPIKIKPHQKHELKIKIATPKKPEKFENFVKVFTDWDGIFLATIIISGNCKQ